MADAGRPDYASGREHPICFAQARDAIFPFNEVIQRAKQENGICPRIRMFEMSRIANFYRGQSMLRLLIRGSARQFHMLRNWIDQMHFVSALGEPAGVNPRAASGIDDRCRGRRHVTENQLLRASVLELKPSGTKS